MAERRSAVSGHVVAHRAWGRRDRASGVRVVRRPVAVRPDVREDVRVVGRGGSRDRVGSPFAGGCSAAGDCAEVASPAGAYALGVVGVRLDGMAVAVAGADPVVVGTGLAADAPEGACEPDVAVLADVRALRPAKPAGGLASAGMLAAGERVRPVDTAAGPVAGSGFVADAGVAGAGLQRDSAGVARSVDRRPGAPAVGRAAAWAAATFLPFPR